MTAVFGVAQHLARFAKHRLGNGRRRLDLAFLGEKVALAPVLPRFERLAVHFGGKLHAKAFNEMQPDDEHARAARKKRTVLP